MPLTTFTPPVAPSPGSSITPELALNRVSFGDGYTQASPRGLNHLRRVLQIKWEALSPDQAKAIETFLVARGGYQAFLYTHPSDGVQRKWTCDTWNVSFGGPCKATATFKEDFSPQS